MGAALLDKLRKVPILKDVNSDQQVHGLEQERNYRSRYCGPSGDYAFTNRQRSL